MGSPKGIKTDKRSHIGSEKLEKLTIIQSTHRLAETRREREAMEKLDYYGKGALWGDEDEQFDLGLTKFGMYIFALKETQSAPKRTFKCWLEDWEVEAIKTPGAVAKTKLREKYQGLVFEWIDEPVTIFTIHDDMRWRSGRVNGGWYVLAEPPEYDGTNKEVLEEFQINEECLIWTIKEYEQPRVLNVENILREENGESAAM